MAKGSATSEFFQKFGQKIAKSHEKHKKDTTTLGNTGDLPSNMEGTAKLVDMGLRKIKEGKKNAGQYMFYAAGVVLSPEVFTKPDGVKVKVQGRRTSITTPLFDTPDRTTRKSLDDHYAWMLNQLRLLGVETADVDSENMEDVFKALVKEGVTFGFRTWGGPTKEYPNGQVNHDWTGLVEVEDAGDGDAVDDDTADGEEEGDEDAEEDGEEEGEEEGDAEEGEGDGDEEGEAGEDEREEEEEEEGEEEEEPKKPAGKKPAPAPAAKKPAAPDVPEQGEILYFAPLDPKTKKPGKKKVEVEVKKVYPKEKCADIVLVDNPSKGFKKIAFARLSDKA